MTEFLNKKEERRAGRLRSDNARAKNATGSKPQPDTAASGKFLLYALCVLCGLIIGCTITPKTVHDKTISFDGNAQNSGFIGYAPDGSGILTPHAHDRYNGLISIYGTNFVPPLKLDAGIKPTATNTFLIDAEHLVDFGKMNHWRKQTLTVPKAP